MVPAMNIYAERSDPNIAALAALLADPARAQIVYALMDGRALTAGELARVGGVTAQTASSHLARLTEGGMLTVERQGRHRYYRISGPDMATLLEQLAVVSGTLKPSQLPRTGPRDATMRRARVCYDHMAGQMGVELFSGLCATGRLKNDDHNVHVTDKGAAMLEAMGIDLDGLKTARRPLCRTCMDWSERRPHLAGGLGAALLSHFLSQSWAHRIDGARTLIFTSDGLRRFQALIRD